MKTTVVMNCLVGVTFAASIMGCAGSREENVKPAAGYVPDAKTAIRIAEAVLIPIYGEKEVQFERPYHAELHGRTWRVYGSLPKLKPGWAWGGGGVAEAVIDRYTGKVLRVTHGE
jgi:hypothetical protein